MEAALFLCIYLELGPRLYSAASSLVESKAKPTEQTSHTAISTPNGKIKPCIAQQTIASIIIETLFYQVKTLYFFMASDLKTVLIPWTLFGLIHAIAAPLFAILDPPSTSEILLRTPLVLLWVILNLLPFTIGNQRHHAAIVQDAINKPWRPLVSKRISPSQARNLMIASYFSAYLISTHIGGASPCIALAILGYLYNDCGGGDNSWISRNVLNGLGFISFGSGAMEVALGGAVRYTPALVNWLKIVALVVATGIQTQDICDREGDALVGRRTMTLVLGEVATRWSIVANVLGWGFYAPFYLDVGVWGYLLPLAGGLFICWRDLLKTTVKEDKKTSKIWNLWLVGIYCLPLVKVLA